MLGIPICEKEKRSLKVGIGKATSSAHRSTHHCTLCGRITPRLVVTREDAQMASSDKLLIVQAQDRVVRIQKVGVEHNLDTIAARVEQLDASDLAQDRVRRVVRHVVRRDRGQRIPLEGEDAPLEQDLVFLR